MTKAQEIPAEIVQEARALAVAWCAHVLVDGAADAIAKALQARDTATRKECAEIAREAQRNSRRNRLDAHPDIAPYHLWAEQQAKTIATAIEATITGGGE